MHMWPTSANARGSVPSPPSAPTPVRLPLTHRPMSDGEPDVPSEPESGGEDDRESSAPKRRKVEKLPQEEEPDRHSALPSEGEEEEEEDLFAPVSDQEEEAEEEKEDEEEAEEASDSDDEGDESIGRLCLVCPTSTVAEWDEERNVWHCDECDTDMGSCEECTDPAVGQCTVLNCDNYLCKEDGGVCHACGPDPRGGPNDKFCHEHFVLCMECLDSGGCTHEPGHVRKCLHCLFWLCTKHDACPICQKQCYREAVPPSFMKVVSLQEQRARALQLRAELKFHGPTPEASLSFDSCPVCQRTLNADGHCKRCRATFRRCAECATWAWQQCACKRWVCPQHQAHTEEPVDTPRCERCVDCPASQGEAVAAAAAPARA